MLVNNPLVVSLRRTQKALRAVGRGTDSSRRVRTGVRTSRGALVFYMCAMLFVSPLCVAAQQPAAGTTETEPAAPVGETSQSQPRGNALLRFFKATTVNVYVDTYYAYNFNRPFDGLNSLRAFDTRHHRFSLNAIGLAFEKTPDEDSRVGYRLDLLFGPAADYLGSAEPGRAEIYKHVQQVYGSYLAPVGSGLQIDFGKLISWSGAESDQILENWNYSRGLLYSFAQPAYHAGVRATYTFSPKVKVMGAVVNGWNNVEDNNGGKTVGLSLELNPTPKLSLTQSYTFGAEQPDGSPHKRHFFDTVITYDFSSRLAVLGNYDYGFDRLADGSRVRWQGASAALRYAPARRFALSPRFEWYADYDGFTTDTPQRLREATLTGEYSFGRGLSARVEYRRDWSDKEVFETSDPSVFKRTRATLASGLIWSFDSSGSASSTEKEPEAPPASPPAATAYAAPASVAQVERRVRPSSPRSNVDAALRVILRPAPRPRPAREARPGHGRDAHAVFTGGLYDYQSPAGEQD